MTTLFKYYDVTTLLAEVMNEIIPGRAEDYLTTYFC